MKMKKRIISVILCMALLTGCGGSFFSNLYQDDEKIAGTDNTFSLDSVKEVISPGQYQVKVERLDGMDTIWSYTAENEEEIDISYQLQVYSGKVKMVWIFPDGTLEVIAEYDTIMEEPVEEACKAQEGINRIKLVVDKNARFDMELSIPEGEFLHLGIDD